MLPLILDRHVLVGEAGYRQLERLQEQARIAEYSRVFTRRFGSSVSTSSALLPASADT